MQLLSQMTLLAMQAAPPIRNRWREFLQHEEVLELSGSIFGWLIAGQIITVVAYWIASKALADRERASVWNAVKLWLAYIVFGVVLIIALGIILPVVVAMKESWRPLLVIGGAAALSILIVFLFPMKIYAIGFFRALGLILLSGVINVVAGFGLQFAAVKVFGLKDPIAALQKIGGETPQEQGAFFARVNGHRAPDEIDYLLDEAMRPIGPRPPLAERERAVLTIQQKLQIRRNALSIAPPAAVADFQRQYGRYAQFLNAVNAERRAQAASGAH